jgi:hypothetical protein
MTITDQVGSVGNASYLHSGSPRSESWPGHRLSQQSFRGFSQFTQAYAGTSPQIWPRLLPSTFCPTNLSLLTPPGHAVA